MKRSIRTLSAALIMASVLACGVSADFGDIKVKTGGVTTAPVQDGVISDGEYGGCAPLVLDGSGDNTEGTWAGTSWGSEKFTIYSAWDKENLYIGLVVEGDTTDAQDTLPAPGAGDADCCPFGKGDSIQIGFNPGGIVEGTHPVLFCIGMNDGECVIHADAYRSVNDGEQSKDYSGKFKTFCTKYSSSDPNYVFETAIPWTEICVKGAGRSGEGAKVFDMTGELAKIGAGYELPFFFVYTDNDGAGGNTYIRTDVTTGCSWVAEEMGSIALVLQAPKTTETGASSDVTASAATADPTAALLMVSALASGAALSLKKRK